VAAPKHIYKKTITFAQIKNRLLKTILHSQQFGIVIERLAHQFLENNPDVRNTAIIGIQPRGIAFSDRIYQYLTTKLGIKGMDYGKLDITFYRDDLSNAAAMREPNSTDINFSIEGKTVILIDDVLYTGRTIRSAMDAILDFGRPAKVELMVLIDRRFSRQLPIQADYIGKSIDSIVSQKVLVQWADAQQKDEVKLIDKES
jgi:pyrimidine operon attenuation protein / uracil phosphoribosyltransferase